MATNQLRKESVTSLYMVLTYYRHSAVGSVTDSFNLAFDKYL